MKRLYLYYWNITKNTYQMPVHWITFTKKCRNILCFVVWKNAQPPLREVSELLVVFSSEPNNILSILLIQQEVGVLGIKDGRRGIVLTPSLSLPYKVFILFLVRIVKAHPCLINLPLNNNSSCNNVNYFFFVKFYQTVILL